MADDTLHPNVAFATKFGDPTGDYLNAHTALWRLDALIEDAIKLLGIFDVVEPEGKRWFPWYGAEIISYYAIGYVTCLEWHARSRLADLFGHTPTSLKAEDLKGQVTEKVMVQLLAQGASVANLISASTTVGSFAKYMNILSRVLAGVGCPHDAWTAVKANRPGTEIPWLSALDLDAMDHLYTFRNELTHEIGSAVVGHVNIRDGWSPATAVESGARVKSLFLGIEHSIREHAPHDFPNLLDEQGYPVWKYDTLRAEIAKLEDEVSRLIERIQQDETVKSDARWDQALLASRQAANAENDFIDHAVFLHSRYISLRSPIQLHIANSRIQYLKMILKHANIIWGDFPD